MVVAESKDIIADVPQRKSRVKDFYDLLKVRLTGVVVFSGIFGYLLGTTEISITAMIALAVGSFLITGSANTINQIIEKEHDKLMKRTKNRPIPLGIISRKEAGIYAFVLAVLGTVIMLYFLNGFATLLSLASLVLYGFVYTPLKRITPLSVLVGAFPGGFPPMIGWVAATGFVGMEGLILFALQFMWQFPHFWAIAWVADKDYKNAGFKMLPFNGDKNVNTAVQISIYTMFLIPIGFLPTQFGMTGITSGIIASLAGAAFLYQTFGLIKEKTDKAALKIMFTSFIYLPIVQIVYLIDKI
ncbi:heme o synthase [Flammeovirga kamogawensis]|uniref:Protoheme IX farnesyltransferase n=1 Tax=Flammeovirga kamogawensis TaxID=373891 RepID=A0ABX8GWX1_9BACT|nr:heme o synthase [Flammeovirga kamogawensis]MBB6461264.1 protoheme IX farnesyltransferase [Flammeovirga kamogawensis]QWG07823.1 heme o synthase [Flammeovirga kamogawensis]TRX69628.1 protoheme IX farnesyltransferase [Flammeovirga kamogawensis]